METKNKSHRYDCVSIDGNNTPNDSGREKKKRKQTKNIKSAPRIRAHNTGICIYIDMMINNIGQKFIVCHAIAWEIKRNEFQIVPFRCYD